MQGTIKFADGAEYSRPFSVGINYGAIRLTRITIQAECAFIVVRVTPDQKIAYYYHTQRWSSKDGAVTQRASSREQWQDGENLFSVDNPRRFDEVCVVIPRDFKGDLVIDSKLSSCLRIEALPAGCNLKVQTG